MPGDKYAKFHRYAATSWRAVYVTFLASTSRRYSGENRPPGGNEAHEGGEFRAPDDTRALLHLKL